MTAFALEPSQVSLAASVRELAGRELLPLVKGASEGKVNRPLLEAMGRVGLLGRLFPETGTASATVLCLLRESLAQVTTEAETALALQGLGGHPIAAAGRPDVVRRDGRPLLVHCYGGASRTGLVLRGWLRRTRGLSPEEATAETVSIWPHTGTWNASFDEALARVRSRE